MANIVIEKRTRALATAVWGSWISTVDMPPYTNTTTVEYRALDSVPEPIDIQLTDLTNGEVVTDADGYSWSGTGVFDVLMNAVNGNIKIQYDEGRIKDSDYARVYLGSLQSTIGAAMQYLLTEKQQEAQADAIRIGYETSKYNLQNAVPLQLEKLQEEVNLALESHADKVQLVSEQLAKMIAETSFIDEQETQLINSVEYNNKIKALASLADVYGTFGAGGLTMSANMWEVLFKIVNDLATVAVPTSTTVSKVV